MSLEKKRVNHIWYSIFENKDYIGEEQNFYEQEQFVWTDKLLKNMDVFRQEFFRYMDIEGEFDPYFNQKLSEGKSRWSTIGLKVWTLNVHHNQEKFPETMKIFDQFHQVLSVSINKLGAGSRIKSHCGDTNAILRCHLGLFIPSGLPECGFKVGNEERNWENGKLLIFCDAKRHEAWNLSEKDRYIILFDILRDEYITKKSRVVSTVMSSLMIQKIILIVAVIFRVKDIQKIEKWPRKWLKPLVLLLRPFALLSIWLANKIKMY